MLDLVPSGTYSLGFVGTGAISSAMIVGLSRLSLNAPKILVGPRNRETARELAKRFANVAVADSNEQVVRHSDIVILAVKPAAAVEVLDSLSFRTDQQLISVVSGLTVEILQCHTAPLTTICLAVPLPSVARNEGITVIYPANKAALQIFTQLGAVLTVKKAAQFQAFCAATGTIASFYLMAESLVHWLETNGLATGEASSYVSAMLAAMFSGQADGSSPDYAALSKQHATEGGLNEVFLSSLNSARLQSAFVEGLDRLRNLLTQT